MALAVCVSLCAGCGATTQTDPDAPKPWAASSTEAVSAEAETAFTHQEELSTLAALEASELGITLPDGMTAADIIAAEQMLWNTCFFTPLPEGASAEEAIAFITDGAVPWGLLRIYDAADPGHTHGAVEQLSVETEPDPLEQFPDLYYKAEDAVMTFLLGDIFGVEPDEAPDGEGYYRQDGFWYFNSLPTGEGGYETHIRACQTLGDGRFRLTAELQQKQEDESLAHARSAFVLIEPVEQEGLRFLKILSIEPFE